MDLGKKEIPEDLKPLYKSIATIPVSTSECERNFSSMNEIMSPLRTSLNRKTVAALLFINCVGPPLTKFEPEKYVRSWLLNGRHSADDTASRKRYKSVIRPTNHCGGYCKKIVLTLYLF
ncbi:unnamed protein product [Macrosiphum euphorbiae]|uniref:HAT C-terminal dimerisation domain-containing protein n=1 Tax=Macrosiphum euphorbiae TaxID=13131 RepID=A0AAV0XUM7_9HEMI|nr:unnamed protein product [Macrosiphum euphorbiae]